MIPHIGGFVLREILSTKHEITNKSKITNYRIGIYFEFMI